jgi:PKD repeat protein
VAGIGPHDVVFTTPVDATGCSGIDSSIVRVADLPDALFLTPDSSWCAQPDNQTIAEILISGSDTSLFDLVIEIRGVLDTLPNLPADTFSLFLNNQVGHNEYVLNKIIEHHGNNTCDKDLNDTLLMQVHPKPDMTVTASYDDFCSPVDVEFTTVAGYDKYYWNFGDNDSTMVRTEFISHTYTIPTGDSLHFFVDTIDGVIDTFYYQVFQLDSIFQYQLAIESFYGCMDTITDTVHIYQSPVADFFVSPEVQNYPETSVFLVNTSSFGDWSYIWDFGDEQTAVVRDPNGHEYGTSGYFDIQLTTYNAYCTDSITKRVQILPPRPTAQFEPDSVGCPPLQITFRNTSEHAQQYIWSFDDDYYSTEENPTHTFYESKEHHVKLIAIGLSGSDTTEQLVVIHERPNALFDVYPRESKILKQNFKFSNTSFNATNYLWDFGDGNSSPEEDPNHIYGKQGTFTITLYAWSEQDCLDTLVRESLITVIAGEGSTKFPNAFVWNGSGPSGGYWDEGTIDNTVFHPHFVNAVKLRMIIYTRWGEKLFETNELYKGWDGYLNSEKLAAPGVYVYRAWVTYMDDTEERLKGDVTFFH